MLLKNIIELRNSIVVCRHEMYELLKNKDTSHPNVLEVSQLLDEKILMMQKMLDLINSSQKQIILSKLNIKNSNNNGSVLEVS